MTIRRYVVVPPMEGGLENLRRIARNLWFSWDHEAVELFRHLDENLWAESSHNPRRVLIRLSKQRLDEILQDEGYEAHAAKVYERFREYLHPRHTYDYHLDEPIDFTTAYFSLEFGLTECLAIYSGGLGLLAGDHLKSASDLNVPLVGVGLMYHDGYFRQRLDADGWQTEVYPRMELDTLPIERQTDAEGNPVRVGVELDGRTCTLRVLRVNVGRVPLYLMDSDIPENPEEFRSLTSRLYGGDDEMRMRQEIILGVGGCRALAAMGIEPAVFHLNEGHAAFTLLERLRHFMEDKGLSHEEAREMVVSQGVLTVHTPVPAGNEVFDRRLIEKYFGPFAARIGMDFESLMGLGRKNPHDYSENFCMPVLGLRLTSYANGVSKLHGRVAREMWHEVWPDSSIDDVPISAVTNGVHIPSYISRDLAKLYDRYLEPGWTEDPDNEKIWKRAESIPDTELWRTRERCRSRLVRFARSRLRKQLDSRGAPIRERERADSALNPDALTICFARRFATYKRAHLLFRNPDRLARLLEDPEEPIQFIFAGKAHPADTEGKDLIKEIIRLIRDEPFRSHVVFIEDYDIHVARELVQGADVWLNTPRRPNEACGTSGMKSSANGALNLSILDGWWDEGYVGDNGWAIGFGEEYDDPAYQDEIESHALYKILEESVKPLFYERGVDGMPRDWIEMMKRSIMTLCPVFNSHRMVSDYVCGAYVPAARNAAGLAADNYAGVREFVSWGRRVQDRWPHVRVMDVHVSNHDEALKGKSVEVRALIDTGGLQPDELRVEVLHGPMDPRHRFRTRYAARLDPVDAADPAGGSVAFTGAMPLEETGLYGYVLRITPEHRSLAPSQRAILVKMG